MASLGATAVILTFNGQKWLEKTLESLSFCDRLLVVDSGSTDATLDIARGAGAEVLYRAWEGTIPQFRFAFTQVATPWIVTLDQDEYLSSELSTSLQSALADPGGAAGFFCSRRSFYYDRFLRHGGWYPDWLLRAFRPDRMELRGVLPHEEFRPTGPTRRLTGDIIHHPYADLAEHLAKINSYTVMAAHELHGRGRRCGLGAAVARGAAKFFRQYVLKQGFLDGRAGFLLAIHAFIYAFHKYAKLAELTAAEQRKPAD